MAVTVRGSNSVTVGSSHHHHHIRHDIEALESAIHRELLRVLGGWGDLIDFAHVRRDKPCKPDPSP